MFDNADRINVIKVSGFNVVRKIERCTVKIPFEIIVLYLNSDCMGNIMSNYVPKLVHRRAYHQIDES